MSRPVPALSELSVTEFLTLSRMGFLPHGLVIGQSIYEAGNEFDWVVATGEVQLLSQALRAARALAVRRLREQAYNLGAEGVVDVKLEVEHDVWRGGRQVAKFVATGTAVGFDAGHAPPALRGAPSLRLADGGPFTSDVSGHDFIALLRAGYRPITVAMGACVYGLDPREMRKYVGVDDEMMTYTQAFFDARELAMERLQHDLFKEHPQNSADAPIGIVGMTVSESVYGGGQSAPIVEFSAIGTAVTYVAQGDPRHTGEHPRPTLVVPLDR